MSNVPCKEIEAAIENLEVQVNSRSPCGKSPLMTACYYCRKDVIEMLIDRGAVVNALSEGSGDTAAHFVTLSLSGHIRQCACVMVLIEKGALIDIKNDDGFTVFDLAAKNGNCDIGNTGETME